MKRDKKIKRGWHVAITIVVASVVMLSCYKASPSHPESDTQSQQDEARSAVETSTRLQYKDSVVFYSDKKYKVKPVEIPRAPGYFVSDPEGLLINATTGELDVNNSESGLRYTIYYMSPDNLPLDSANVTVAGIDYSDGIFEINRSPQHEEAVPVYNGTTAGVPCSQDSANPLACVFDETDLDGNGTRDVPGANRGKLRVNKKTGEIDLEQSLSDGVFGPNPSNGLTKDFTIYYRLNDESRRAVSNIKVRLYYFSSRDKIPQSLLNELIARKGGSVTEGPGQPNGNFIQSNLLSILKPKRPPLIIIVSGYSAL